MPAGQSPLPSHLLHNKIIVLSTDMLHHVYFINKLKAEGFPICGIVYEPRSFKSTFETTFIYGKEEEEFNENFKLIGS